MAPRGDDREDEAALDRRQRSVRRYTQLVRWMKVLLPVAALALVALIFLQGRERGSVEDLLSAEELARLGAGLRLEEPRFAGVTDGGEPFVVTADWALPDSAMPDRIDLEKPRGEISLSDGRTIVAEARTGQLLRPEETLALSGDVVIERSDGYRVTTEALTIDFGAKTAHAPGAVSGRGPDGEIDAGSFRADARDSGLSEAHIWFENRVRVLFIPSEGG